MQKILITGFAGFIGSHLTERLLSDGYTVLGIDNFDPFYLKRLKEDNIRAFIDHPNFSMIEGDITAISTWNSITTPVDLVIHLAAKAGVLPSLQDPAGYLNTNVLGTQLLLNWMKENGVNHLIFGSSSSVYGNNKMVPFEENMDVTNPISNYAFTKVAGETLIKTHHNLYNLSAICLRFFTVIGERQRPDLAVNKFIRLIENDEPVTMYGDGSTSRDYTYVGDIVNGIISAIAYLKNNVGCFEIINLGNSNPISLKDMISTIYRLLDKRENIITMPMQPGDVLTTYADISKAGKLLHYAPQISFEQGVRKFLTWRKKH